MLVVTVARALALTVERERPEQNGLQLVYLVALLVLVVGVAQPATHRPIAASLAALAVFTAVVVVGPRPTARPAAVTTAALARRALSSSSPRNRDQY